MPHPHIPNVLRRLVTERALECCEYCLVHQDDRPESHQVDHLISLKHGGQTVSENLALACAICNHYKGSDLASIDPVERVIVPLFNPRAQEWGDHFQLAGVRIIGLTPTGRATIELLRLNEDDCLTLRQALMEAKRYPPSVLRKRPPP